MLNTTLRGSFRAWRGLNDSATVTHCGNGNILITGADAKARNDLHNLADYFVLESLCGYVTLKSRQS